MKSETEACRVKTRHSEYSLALPVIALVVLALWGNTQNLPAIAGIN
ncbi:sodium-potassium/proton antiporter ChaA, partial [Salmonella enterica subsp. enterica serovar Enteritidis]|nr:sodium-potassium/proton antiporter ChaA [Salmonella enterica subsp. enterica serovar Enteritidis]